MLLSEEEIFAEFLVDEHAELAMVAGGTIAE